MWFHISGLDKPKQTFILDGSPKANGNTATLLRHAVKELNAATTSVVRVFQSAIACCTNCGACKTDASCCIKDDMATVYQHIQSADSIIIASPVYFGMLPGPVLNILSRFQPFFINYHKLPSQGKAKKGIILLTAGGSGGHAPAEEKAKIMLRMMNATWLGTAAALKTDTIPVAKDKKALEDAAALAQLL